MGKSPDPGSNAVQSLLSDRTQFEEWLAKLAASNAPDAVRRRVQADYEARLSKIMESLRQHTDAIIADLERFRGSERDLERREGEALETVSEAELRHAVGEFSDAKWSEISRVQNVSLDSIRKELSRVRHEIGRLTEVQGSIAGERPGPAAAQEVAADRPSALAPEPVPATSPAVESPKPAPAPEKKPVPSDDELDFLKSVAVDQSSSLSPQNASDHQPSAEESVPAATPARSAASTSAAAAPVATAPMPAKSPAAASSNQAKTLKCGECGTLNRPTEWYCERCGAELAAL